MAKKVMIPWELKYDFAIRGYTSMHKRFLNAIREQYGATTALEIYERVLRMGDSVKNLTNTIRKIFKLEGNDAETIAKFQEIWWELTGLEGTWLERSKTIARCKVTKCLWKTEFKDLGDFSLIFENIAHKTINPKATVERPKGMCAGDPYCEYIFRIEE